MMKWALILGLSIGMVVVNEQPAEAGFFRRGPMRRFLFGGPIRRRMIARRMFRRGFCGNCMPRRVVPRCGAGVHGGRCGFGNPNFRDFRNQRNFRFFGDPLRSQFDPGLNPAFNPFINPNAAQFFPFQNSQPFNPNGNPLNPNGNTPPKDLAKVKGKVVRHSGDFMPGYGPEIEESGRGKLVVTPISNARVFAFSGELSQKRSSDGFSIPSAIDTLGKAPIKVVRADEDGQYQLDLPPGKYTVVAEINGELRHTDGGGPQYPNKTWSTITVSAGEQSEYVIVDDQTTH